MAFCSIVNREYVIGATMETSVFVPHVDGRAAGDVAHLHDFQQDVAFPPFRHRRFRCPQISPSIILMMAEKSSPPLPFDDII